MFSPARSAPRSPDPAPASRSGGRDVACAARRRSPRPAARARARWVTTDTAREASATCARTQRSAPAPAGGHDPVDEVPQEQVERHRVAPVRHMPGAFEGHELAAERLREPLAALQVDDPIPRCREPRGGARIRFASTYAGAGLSVPGSTTRSSSDRQPVGLDDGFRVGLQAPTDHVLELLGRVRLRQHPHEEVDESGPVPPPVGQLYFAQPSSVSSSSSNGTAGLLGSGPRAPTRPRRRRRRGHAPDASLRGLAGAPRHGQSDHDRGVRPRRRRGRRQRPRWSPDDEYASAGRPVASPVAAGVDR